MKRLFNRRMGLTLAIAALIGLGVSWRDSSDLGTGRGPASTRRCSRGGGSSGGTDGEQKPLGEGAVCKRWKEDRADLSEGTWTGSVSSCNPGDYTGPGKANVLKLINLYRWMAGLNSNITDDPGSNTLAQACSLMITANGTLNHSPPSSWRCYSSNGAAGAGSSNEASTPAVYAIDLYMEDPGNPQTIGHRRWILSNGLSTVGIGSTNQMSCLQIVHGFGGGPQYTAWPPPGDFPIEAAVDGTGWTIQSDSIGFGGASVTVTDNGQNRPVTVTQLLGNYGSYNAISFIPQGWSSQAGHSYRVTVSGTTPSIAYTVRMVNCAAQTAVVKSKGIVLEEPLSHEPATVTVAWMQPAAKSGWGPDGSITVSGVAKNGSGGVVLEYRTADNTTQILAKPWSVANMGYAATPTAEGYWYNTILPPLGRYYQVRARYNGVYSKSQCIGPADAYTQCP